MSYHIVVFTQLSKFGFLPVQESNISKVDT